MVIIPDYTLAWANLSESQLLQEVAMLLYQKGKLTFGQAAQTAQLSYPAFQMLLGENQIPVQYGEAQLAEDIKMIEKLSL